MRARLLFGLMAVSIVCILANCGSLTARRGIRAKSASSCLQCNVVSASGGECPVCKGALRTTDVAKACPRCGMACGRVCPLCGVHSVSAIQYFKCPGCGMTIPEKGGRLRSGKRLDSLPKCQGCGRGMQPQTVPLRALCPDCGIWSSRIGPCPRCSVDMSPM